ncbi:hypothetical protein SAMN05428944_5139 [Streptomyces sp. 1222.5]|nr:hypothetical protein BX260_2958 [Streptomyces sp. 5112.2]SEC79946.1 hypothetical protein SAMN05428944_5139 [Streptomyces sp. 1222.5]
MPAGAVGIRLRPMDWTTPVSTLIGALVGVGSTLLSESVRARRDRGNQSHQLRRQLYARYLEALTSTDSDLQLLAVRERAPVAEADLRAAWRGHSLLALHYEIGLVAPPPVTGAADTAYRALRAARNALVAAGATAGDSGTPDGHPRPAGPRDVRGGYIDALAALRAAMRADVGDGRG